MMEDFADIRLNSHVDTLVDLAMVDERYDGLGSYYINEITSDVYVMLFSDDNYIFPAPVVFLLLNYDMVKVQIVENPDDEIWFDLLYWDPILHKFCRDHELSDEGKRLFVYMLLRLMEVN